MIHRRLGQLDCDMKITDNLQRRIENHDSSALLLFDPSNLLIHKYASLDNPLRFRSSRIAQPSCIVAILRTVLLFLWSSGHGRPVLAASQDQIGKSLSWQLGWSGTDYRGVSLARDLGLQDKHLYSVWIQEYIAEPA